MSMQMPDANSEVQEIVLEAKSKQNERVACKHHHKTQVVPPIQGPSELQNITLSEATQAQGSLLPAPLCHSPHPPLGGSDMPCTWISSPTPRTSAQHTQTCPVGLTSNVTHTRQLVQKLTLSRLNNQSKKIDFHLQGKACSSRRYVKAELGAPRCLWNPLVRLSREQYPHIQVNLMGL